MGTTRNKQSDSSNANTGSNENSASRKPLNVDLEKIREAFKEAKSKAPGYTTKKQYVSELSKEIKDLLRSGLTPTEVLKMMADGGLELTPSTLKNYLSKASSKKRGKTTSNKGDSGSHGKGADSDHEGDSHDNEGGSDEGKGADSDIEGDSHDNEGGSGNGNAVTGLETGEFEVKPDETV